MSLMWQYGTCNGQQARRHRVSGAVQFVLWKAGEQGHTSDYWHAMDPSHWPKFKPAEKPQENPMSDEDEKYIRKLREIIDGQSRLLDMQNVQYAALAADRDAWRKVAQDLIGEVKELKTMAEGLMKDRP